MTRPKPKATTKLSPLGDSAEKMLTILIRDMRDDLKKPADQRRYSLTDHMKAVDRVAKFESIRAHLPDGSEGAFFTNRDKDDDD